jgi:capsular polysaccharide biosynthesis protein
VRMFTDSTHTQMANSGKGHLGTSPIRSSKKFAGPRYYEETFLRCTAPRGVGCSAVDRGDGGSGDSKDDDYYAAPCIENQPTLPRRRAFATIGAMMAEENTGGDIAVDARMAARALGGALLIAIVAAIIVTLVSLAMFLREPIYEPTARVWVERELLVSPPSPGPDKRLTDTTLAMVRLAASRPVAEEARRRFGLQTGSTELLENLEIHRVSGTTFMDLTYRGTDRKKATQAVNALATVASERLSEAGNKNLMAAVWEEAQVPSAVPEPKPLRNGLLTLVVVWALYAGFTLFMLVVLRR